MTERTSVRMEEVGPQENGRKLLSFLEARLGSLPQGLFMRIVRTGQVRIDGKRCKPFDRVQAGQTVRIPPVTVDVLRPAAPSRPEPGLDIVYQDEAMLVVNKPAGLPVHRGSGWTDSVHDRLHTGAPFSPTPVHRLDRDTSGLLLCAKTHDFLRRMHELWPLVTKAYLCWVQGRWPHPDWRTIVSELAKTGADGAQRVTSGNGQRAVSHVHPVLSTDRSSLLLVALGTGRTHQIRVHLADSGHPICGDPKYGQGGALRLHAAYLAWEDRRFFRLPSWPADFAVPTALGTDIIHLCSTAPAKEGAS